MTTITLNEDLDSQISRLAEQAHASVEEVVNDILAKFLNIQPTNDDFKIDVLSCLNALEKIENANRSELIEIGDIDDYIKSLKNEINKN